MSTTSVESPEISVCLLAWNHDRYIGRCIESVLDQEVNVRIEILIGDDASTDNTSKIISRYAQAFPDIIQHIHRHERLGGSANYIDLLARARAPLIAHLDGDDFWLPGKLQQQVTYLREHPDCAAVYTNAITIAENGDRIGIFNDFHDLEIRLPELLARGNFLCNSSALHRHEACTEIFAINGPILDYRTHLIHATMGKIAQFPEALTAYRVNSVGSTVAQANDLVRELYWEAIQSVPRELVSDGDYVRGLADFLRRVFFRAVRTHDARLFHSWRTRIFAASPYGPLRTSALMISAITRIAGKTLAGYIRGGNHRHVLYRH